MPLQARNRSAAKRSHEPLDPLFSKLVPNEAATLDNRSIDPTVNLSVDRFDNSAGASAVDNTFSHVGNPHQMPQDYFAACALCSSVLAQLTQCS